MKRLLLLWQRTAADAAVQCCTSATHDINRVASRCEHEGLSFLTLTLPALGKEFERALDQGRVTDALLSYTGQKRGFPVLFQDFLQLVFARDGGRLLDEPSPEAIQAIRQLTLMFGKVRLPCRDTRVTKAFDDFVECEQQMKAAEFQLSLDDLSEFGRISDMLFADAFSRLDLDVYDGVIVGQHGPGATADKLRGNAKFNQREWTDRLEEYFPAMENLIPSYRFIPDLDDLQWLDPGSELPVRVVSVPKTMKTPRIIAIEPTCMQYMQQGLMVRLVKYLESNNLTRGMIGILDQFPNQELAREGSLTGELATLDLSEASDRVSNQLVTTMLGHFPHLSGAVQATRSVRADVPGHGIIPLVKFASMGSALTFPIEVCVFLTLIFVGIQKSLGRRLTPRDVASLRGQVRAYGDDLIVPVTAVPSVVETLELYGFKVNRSKSFWTGKFRESCGKEYYNGHDVSICRVRSELPAHRRDGPGLVSLVALRNQLYWAGYWGTARFLDELLETLIPFPIVSPESPVHGRESVLPIQADEIHSRYQYPVVLGMLTRSRIPTSPLDGVGALHKCLTKQGELPFVDARHLERQGRPDVVDIYIGKDRAI
jgi:hypothetical protein